MKIGKRHEAVINIWFKEHGPMVFTMLVLLPYIDEHETAQFMYQRLWNNMVPTFDDKQISRLEAVLLTYGATIDCQGTQVDIALDFFDPQDENELQE